MNSRLNSTQVQVAVSIPDKIRLNPLQRLRLAVWRHPGRAALLASFAATAGMTISILLDLPMRSSSFAASDFKTLFASAWCFGHGRNAYSIADLKDVFASQGVVAPGNWFAHAPVYPPTTLALLAPLSSIPMVPAAYLVILLSAALFALALASLVHEAAEAGCSLGEQAAIIALCVASPLLAFALSIGNVSVAASSLCIVAFLRRRHGSGWLYGAALAVAVLLKPHLAIWMMTGMLLLPEDKARRVAMRAAAFTAAAAALTVAFLLQARHFTLQAQSFAQTMWSETSAGSSMSTSSHEVIPIVAQITSLHSLLGFWWNDSLAQSAWAIVLTVALGFYVGQRVRRTRDESNFAPALGAWIAFGLLATYHRAHDALLLLMLIPWLLRVSRNASHRWCAWGLLLLYEALSFSLPFSSVQTHLAAGEYSSVGKFLLLRQAALAIVGILLILLLRLLDKPPRLNLAYLAQTATATPDAVSAS